MFVQEGLIEEGSDHKDYTGWTAHCFAVKNNFKEAVKLLIAEPGCSERVRMHILKGGDKYFVSAGVLSYLKELPTRIELTNSELFDAICISGRGEYYKKSAEEIDEIVAQCKRDGEIDKHFLPTGDTALHLAVKHKSRVVGNALVRHGASLR